VTAAQGGPALSVLVPCFNEEANIEPFVERSLAALAAAGIDAEILLVDDGSRDRTQQNIEAMAQRHREVRGLRHETNRGIAECWKTAASAARAPVLLITDADLQYAPEDIPRLHRLLESDGADIVQGRRTIEDSGTGYRSALSAAFSGVLNRLFDTRLRDVKSGFLCAPRRVFQAMLEMRYHYRCPQHFIVVNAVSQGFRVRQEPVVFGPRRAGRSFIRSPLQFALRALTDLPRALWEFRILNRRRRTS